MGRLELGFCVTFLGKPLAISRPIKVRQKLEISLEKGEGLSKKRIRTCHSSLEMKGSG